MAISNKTGAMVVTTGNRSEMSVGYATLYGDMNGGFNPIEDIYKTEVFRLSSLRNEVEAGRCARAFGRGDPGQHHHAAADGRVARGPDRPAFAAALRGAGWDSGASGGARGAAGHDHRGRLQPADVVTRIDRLLNIAECKRRQAAPGVKVSGKNFGRDRRYPITNRFRDNGKALPAPDGELVARAGRASWRMRSRDRDFSSEVGQWVRVKKTRQTESRARYCFGGDEGRAHGADLVLVAAVP